MLGAPVNIAKEWEPLARELLASMPSDGPAAEPGTDAGGGVRVLVGDEGAKNIECVSALYTAAGSDLPPLRWVDEYTQFLWPNKVVRGATLQEILKKYGEGAVVRLVGVAARGARRMRAANGFKLQNSATDAEEDDRLQLVRSLCYLAWGFAYGSITKRVAAAGEAGGQGHYYVISTGIKSLPLCGPFSALLATLQSSSTIEKEVRGKYFPRALTARLEEERPAELAPQVRHHTSRVPPHHSHVSHPAAPISRAADESRLRYDLLPPRRQPAARRPARTARVGDAALRSVRRQPRSRHRRRRRGRRR